MEILEENEGNIAQVCVNCKGGLQMFAFFFFWHREGWTARNEALLEEVFFVPEIHRIHGSLRVMPTWTQASL